MLPKGARVHSDGSVTFPVRGDPPQPIQGYVQDPGDPFRWIMSYVTCKHRILNQSYKCSSGQIRTRDFCPLIGLPINPSYCNQACPRPEERS
jgi:hypothetical protein